MKQKRCVMQGIEASVLWGDELNFEPHCHDEYVISTNVIGNERLILDGQAMTAREGATTLYNPGHVQGGSGTSVLVSLYLEPDFFEKKFQLEGLTEFAKPIVEDKNLALEMMNLITPIMMNVDSLILEDQTIPILYKLSEQYAVRTFDTINSNNDWRFTRVKEVLEDVFPESPPLEELAAIAGVSIPTLTKIFVNETGLPPISWQRTKRLAQARAELKKGRQVCDVATQLGFSDQAHMTRFFGRSFGIAPGKFAGLY